MIQSRAAAPGGIRLVAAALLCAAVFGLEAANAQPAAAAARWLPPDTPYPRLLADPREPGIALTYIPDPDRFDAALGAPLPLMRFGAGGRDLTLVLEAGAFFRLGKDGTFFPLRTFDGLLGMGLETGSGRFRARLKVFHVSAHKADGDPSVAYRDRTFSRESWRLEAGLAWSRLFLFAGAGASWHAVPEDDGPHLVAGGQWDAADGTWRPFLAVHLLADRERAWRVNQSLFAGLRTGAGRRFRLGLRYYSGNRAEGQYWSVPEQYLGMELQFSSYPTVTESHGFAR